MRDIKKYFAEEKEISNYLGIAGRTADDKRKILDECWTNEDTRQRYLKMARGNLEAAEPKDNGTQFATTEKLGRNDRKWDKAYVKSIGGYVRNLNNVY